MSWSPYRDTLPRPRRFDVVWCNFPDSDILNPGPKPRPGLVRRVLVHPKTNEVALEVCYGSSQIKRIGIDLFVSDPAQMQAAGLTLPTRFELSLRKIMPWASEFFAVREYDNKGPVIGHLHPQSEAALEAVCQQSGLRF